MSLLDRILGRTKSKIKYPPALAREIEKAMHGLEGLTAAHHGTWRMGDADWTVEQDQGTIVFTTPKGIRAIAPVQFIGTYNSLDGTWLWAWANSSVEEPLSRDARRVLSYGRQHGYDVLTTRKLQCPEQQCWELTAFACMLCEAQCAYRGPAGSTMVFMTFGTVKLGNA